MVAAIGNEPSYQVKSPWGLNIAGIYGGAHKVGGTRAVEGYGFEGGSGNIGQVNLENKTGTSNQTVHLPGGRVSMAANKLDFSA